MAKIIISHKKEYGERWRPFEKDRRDIIRIVCDVWNNMKGTRTWEDLIKLLKGREPCCDPIYPPETRPVTIEDLKDYHGCIFDFDAYREGKPKYDYLVAEVEFLKKLYLEGKCVPGGVSKPKGSSPTEKDWFQKINNERDIKNYLAKLIAALIASDRKKQDPISYDDEFQTQAYDNASGGLGRYRGN